MTRVCSVLVASLLSPLAAAPAWAASGGEVSAESLKILGLALLNFVILGGVIWRFGRPPVAAFLFQRSEEIRRKLETSQQQLADAQAEIAALRERLGQLDREAGELVALSKRQATGERERMEARARETADRIRAETERVAEVEIQRARQELREEAAALATSVAGDLLEREFRPEDDGRLIQEFTSRLEETTH